MAKVDLKGVYRVKAKGKVYYYAWRGPGAPRLLSEPGTAAFVEELSQALAERVRPDSSRFAGVVALYKASDDWKGLADKTRRNWTLWLDRATAHFGPMSIGAFDRPKARVYVRKWRDRYRDTPRSADMGLQVVSRVLSFAIEEGLINTNVCAGITRLYHNDRSELVWTADDIEALGKVASKELMQAVHLARLTGLRQGDLIRLSWSHIKPHSIEIRTGKSKGAKTTLIPLHTELRAFLATIPKRATTVLTNQSGRPWATGFGASWTLAMGRLTPKLDLHFHDLRGTAATRLYLADISIREIAEIMTWSEDRVERLIDRYVKRDELLKDRIRRMDEAEARTRTEKPTAKPVGPEGA